MPPMAWGALSLAIVSFLFIALGVVFTPVPGVGALFAFAAPVLALAGIILGGRAVTRSKAAVPAGGGTASAPSGGASGLALAAVIASALAFVPAMITALTCGACNALCASGHIETHRRFGTSTGTIDPLDMLRRSQLGSLLDRDASLVMPADSAKDETPDAGAPTAPSLPPPPLAPGPKP